MSNQAVSHQLLQTIRELQSLISLAGFGLAGGTNLALHFNHRVSVDIDLFSGEMIRMAGFERIKSEVNDCFKGNLLLNEIENIESGEQYCFLKALIQKEATVIKIEIIQNVPLLDPIEIVRDIKKITIRDIALLKLTSICSRKALKDLYDLDLLTDHDFTLGELMEMLAQKETHFNAPEQGWLFDLDDPPSPVEDISLLLEIDNIDYQSLPLRPNHSNDILRILPPNKDIQAARRSWRRKVRQLMTDRGMELPGIRPIN
jgi:hypothetical protein